MVIFNFTVEVTDELKAQIKKSSSGREYLNFTGFISQQKNEFGNDVSVAHRQSKEEREAKEKRKYVGGGEVVFGKDKIME